MISEIGKNDITCFYFFNMLTFKKRNTKSAPRKDELHKLSIFNRYFVRLHGCYLCVGFNFHLLLYLKLKTMNLRQSCDSCETCGLPLFESCCGKSFCPDGFG